MRIFILTLGLAAIAAPAAAQPPRYDAPRYQPAYDERLDQHLPSPREVARVGNAIARFADALMDVRIGPVVDAIDPYRRYDGRGRPETIGDVAADGDPYARARIHRSTGAATAGVGAATHEAAAMAPVLRHSLADAIRRVEDAMDGVDGPYPPRR